MFDENELKGIGGNSGLDVCNGGITVKVQT